MDITQNCYTVLKRITENNKTVGFVINGYGTPYGYYPKTFTSLKYFTEMVNMGCVKNVINTGESFRGVNGFKMSEVPIETVESLQVVLDRLQRIMRKVMSDNLKAGKFISKRDGFKSVYEYNVYLDTSYSCYEIDCILNGEQIIVQSGEYGGNMPNRRHIPLSKTDAEIEVLLTEYLRKYFSDFVEPKFNGVDMLL